MLVAPFASASSHTVLQAGDTVHCRLRLGAAVAPCTRRGPSVPLCGSLWPSLDRRPTAPPACSCRCALAPPIGCGTSSPPLRTPARDASKSCPPADHPQTLSAAPTSCSLFCSVLSRPQRTAISKQPDTLLAEQCGIQCSAVQRSSKPSRHPEKRPGAPSSWPAANRFLLQPRTLPFSSSLFQLALPAVIPIIPQTRRSDYCWRQHHERAVSSAQLHIIQYVLCSHPSASLDRSSLLSPRMTLDFNVNGGGDALLDLTFEQQQRDRAAAYAYSTTTTAHSSPGPSSHLVAAIGSWPLPVNMNAASAINSPQEARGSSPEEYHPNSPLSHMPSPHSHPSPVQHSPYQQATNPLTDWALHHHQQQAAQHHQHHALTAHDMTHYIQESTLVNYNAYPSYQPNPIDYLPPTTQAAMQTHLLESPFSSMPPLDDTAHAMHWGGAGMGNWQDFQNTLQLDGLQTVGSNSPTGTYLEVLSLPSSSSGDGWAVVDWETPAMSYSNLLQALPSSTHRRPCT